MPHTDRLALWLARTYLRSCAQCRSPVQKVWPRLSLCPRSARASVLLLVSALVHLCLSAFVLLRQYASKAAGCW
eukprot:2895421-Alexandrium_andersonii.AAC.1